VPALKPPRPGHRLTHGDGPGEDGGIERSHHLGLAQALLDQVQRLLSKRQLVLSQVELGAAVLEQFLGDELSVEQLACPLVVALGLPELKPGPLHVLLLLLALGLQLPVVELEEQLPRLDPIAHVDGQNLDLAVDLGAHADLLGRGDVAALLALGIVPPPRPEGSAQQNDDQNLHR